MIKVRVLSAVTFAAGTRLALDPRQAGARQHAVRPLGKGLFEVSQPVQFKAGETLGVESDVPKALFEALEGDGIPKPATASPALPKKGRVGKKEAASPLDVEPPAGQEGE